MLTKMCHVYLETFLPKKYLEKQNQAVKFSLLSIILEKNVTSSFSKLSGLYATIILWRKAIFSIKSFFIRLVFFGSFHVIKLKYHFATKYVFTDQQHQCIHTGFSIVLYTLVVRNQGVTAETKRKGFIN